MKILGIAIVASMLMFTPDQSVAQTGDKPACAQFCDRSCKKRVADGKAKLGFDGCVKRCLNTQKGGSKCT